METMHLLLVATFLLLTTRMASGLSSVVKPNSNIPSTPCTRICRYNADFYDGQVCIGCFRDTFEISQWASMSNTERSYALMDAADRVDDADDSPSLFEGAVSKEELLRQAEFWDSLAGDEKE
jgi:predicted Fe-S protein YdhL (DUF1289 family)